jgi:hypothetical protein
MLKSERLARKQRQIDRRLTTFMQLLVRGWCEVGARYFKIGFNFKWLLGVAHARMFAWRTQVYRCMYCTHGGR